MDRCKFSPVQSTVVPFFVETVASAVSVVELFAVAIFGFELDFEPSQAVVAASVVAAG